MRCPACDARLSGRPARVPAGYTRCPGCSLAHLEQLPTPAAAAARFDANYFAGDAAGGYPCYAAQEEVQRGNARRVLDLVAPALHASGARLLDVGCGYGVLLEEARRRGWDVTGVDVSAHARREAAARFSLDVVEELETLPREGDGFAAITCLQVLHHVADPGALLEGMAARLRPGGLLALETVDRGARVARLLGRRWPLPAAPWTVWLFDRRSLTRMLARHGFAVVAAGPARKRVGVRHLALALAARGVPGAGRLAAGLPSRAALPYVFGDIALLLARGAT
jgi:SAM-dependent methyltransferase